MWKDPIVQEVRKAGEELARQADYDLHTFFRNCEKMRGKDSMKSLKEQFQRKG